MNNIEQLVDKYYDFLKERTAISRIQGSEWVEISTPFTDVYNDTIDIYARREHNDIILSDDGQTLRNLELSGVEISRSQKRRHLLDSILLNHGVNIVNEEFTAKTTESNFPQTKHNLLAAIAETNDLYVLATHTVGNLFREDVKNYLDDQGDIIYTPYFISRGAVGLEFTFDFQIAYKRTEILIKSFNSVNKFNLPHFLFTWEDVKQVREKQVQKKVNGLAIINDENKEVKTEYLDALQNKCAKHISWSERHKKSNLQLLREAV